MNRRRFIKSVAAAGGASLAVNGTRASGRRQAISPFPEVVVVGAGAFGGWTALNLVERGVAVTLVDAYGPGNARATSGGETRQIRVGYGDREIYSRWVLKAFDLWKSRQAEWGLPLMYETGRLLLSPDWTSSMRATADVLTRLDVPVESLTPEEIVKRYPQLRPEGIGVGLLEPMASVIRARWACQAVVEDFKRKGGVYTVARAEVPETGSGRIDALRLSNGDSLVAGSFVFACGPWLPKLFPSLMGKKLFVPRRDVFFFGTPEGDRRFSHPHLPNYSESDYYGFASIESRGFKVCPTGELTVFDPDNDERIASAWQLSRARDYLAMRFPALKDQPLVESRVCQLEMTTDEHFVIQPHPSWPNVWIAGGGSGHGFKHGPVLGDYIAERVMGEPAEPELEALFRLKAEEFRIGAGIEAE